jgi:hypothetical protein
MTEPQAVSEPVHPECERMHRHGYCVCTMVECVGCDKAHPPHKPCGAPPARDILKPRVEEPKR